MTSRVKVVRSTSTSILRLHILVAKRRSVWEGSHGKEKKLQVHTCTTSKRIEQESRGWSGLVIAIKPDQPGLSSLIRLDVLKDK